MSMIRHHLSIFGPLNALKIIGSDSLNEPGQKTKDPLREVMVAWCRWGPKAHCSKCTLLVFNDFITYINRSIKGNLSYHLCIECFSQLSFDSEVYTKSAAFVCQFQFKRKITVLLYSRALLIRKSTFCQQVTVHKDQKSLS